MVAFALSSGRKIGDGEPCFLIAEAGVNHNGDLRLAHQLIDVASEAGVDAVKFQTFRAERLVTRGAQKANYQMATSGTGESQFEMLRKLELSHDAHRELQISCREKGIMFLSTPFDTESADFLETLSVPLFKVGSGELTNLQLLLHIAKKNRPMVVSTGMSKLNEVSAAVETIRKAGNQNIILLHCVSSYPADPVDVNLRAMKTIREAFQLPVGYSDHTLGNEVALAAVALGACVLEKHFTLDRKMPGPDHQASLEPHEFISFVGSIRRVESALGHGRKEPVAAEADVTAVARRSLVAARRISAGCMLTEDSVAIMRPGTGLPPTMMQELLGKRAKEDIEAGSLLKTEMFE